MAESDTDTKLDEIEQSNLQTMISQVEAALAGSTPSARGLLENFLHNAKARVGVLEKKIKDSQAEREARSSDDAATAALAAKETALTVEEREVYRGFLAKEYFTKHDFADLERFYTHSWDRLSEGGKDLMSHRIFEGIRRDEYTFTELPEKVREKETGRTYSALVKRGVETQAIPENDRKDFCRAFEEGRRKDAESVLERESFKKCMFLSAESKRIEHGTVERGQETEADAIANRIRENTLPSERPAEQASQEEATTLRRKGVSLKTAATEVSSSSIPVNGTPAKNQSPSFPS